MLTKKFNKSNMTTRKKLIGIIKEETTSALGSGNGLMTKTNNLMKKQFLIYLMCLFSAINAFSQTTHFVSSESNSPDVVKLTINCLSQNRKTFENDALIAAIKVVLYEGVPDSQYNKPLLSVGDKTAYQEHEAYFTDFFENGRFTDFIKSFKQLTKFKKAENKGTLFEVEIKILQLRRDLEKNRISNKMGY